MAQEAAIPTIAPPAPVAAPAPAPEVVTRSNPVVQQVPTTPQTVAEAAPAEPARTAARSRPAPRADARAAPQTTAPAAAVAAPVAPIAVVPPTVPIAQDPILAPPAAVPVAATVVDANGLTGAEAGLLALLAAAGLAGAGLLVARSRRKPADDEMVEDAALAPPRERVPEPEPVFVSEPALERFARPAAPLHAGPEPAGDARAALLERMVAAAPDEDNPFLSRKRRVRRARMLLSQREAAARRGRSDQFDWRTYQASGQPAERSEAEDRTPVPYPT